jgi:hypothetical protein
LAASFRAAPLGFDAGDANVYRYVFSGPTNYTDPSGQIAFAIAAGGLLAANAYVGLTLAAALDRMSKGEPVPCYLLANSPQYWGGLLMSAAVGAAAPVIGAAIASGISPAAANMAGAALGAAGLGAGLGGAAREAQQGNYISAGMNLGFGLLSGGLGLKALSSARALAAQGAGSRSANASGANPSQPSAPSQPPLKRIHPESTYAADPEAKASLEYWRTRPTSEIVKSLEPGATKPLTTKPDGRMMDGNTRTKVLQERGYDIDSLPREVRPPDPILDLDF